MKKGSWEKCLIFFAALMITFIYLPGVVFAEDMAETTKEIRELRETSRVLLQRVQELEEKMQKYQKTEQDTVEVKKDTESLKAEIKDLKKLKEALGHLEISGGVTSVVQGTGNNGNNPPKYDDSTNAEFTMDLNLATHFGKYGNFYVHLESGDGEGLNNDVQSFSIPNYDSYSTRNHNNQPDLTVSEAFYEFNFLNDKFTLDAGKMDISVLFDENEVAGDETTQFLSNIFVKSMGLTIPEPDNFYCPAFMVKVDPTDLLEFRVIGASVQDDNWDDVFDHGFLAWQVNVRPKFWGRQGNYRFYGWCDKRRHLKNSNLAIANGRPTPVYDDRLAGKDQMGWGISFDQELLDGVSAFARYSQTSDDLSRWNGDEDRWEMIPFNRLWTVGLQLSGSLWHRENDVIGMGYGQTLLTDDYKKVTSHTSNENNFEAYYKLVLHERFALTGDFQWIKNGQGNSQTDDIYIWGLRAQLDF